MNARPLSEDEWGNFGWVGSPRCESQTEDEKVLIARRADIEFVGGIADPDADYSYDDFALVLLDGVYYLCESAGCSCPSPSETWGVEHNGTLSHIRECLVNGDYDGYTVPSKCMAEFLAMIDAEAARFK